MGVHLSTCLYISTKDTIVHGGTSSDVSSAKTVVRRRTNTYDEYRRFKPKQDICTDLVGKVQKGIIYADALQKGS